MLGPTRVLAPCPVQSVPPSSLLFALKQGRCVPQLLGVSAGLVLPVAGSPSPRVPTVLAEEPWFEAAAPANAPHGLCGLSVAPQAPFALCAILAEPWVSRQALLTVLQELYSRRWEEPCR